MSVHKMPLIASSLFDFVCARKALLVLGRCVGDEGRGMVSSVPAGAGGQKNVVDPKGQGLDFRLSEIAHQFARNSGVHVASHKPETPKNVRFVVKSDDCVRTVWLSCY